MAAEIHQLRTKPVATNWMCSACGEDASCNCGAPLMSKQKAKDHFTANPDDSRSDGTIAAELGVGRSTVQRARDEVAHDGQPDDKRIGRDGKTYPARVVRDDPDEFDERLAYAQTKNAFIARAAQAESDAKYVGKVDQEIISAAEETAAAWCQLVSDLKGKSR